MNIARFAALLLCALAGIAHGAKPTIAHLDIASTTIPFGDAMFVIVNVEHPELPCASHTTLSSGNVAITSDGVSLKPTFAAGDFGEAPIVCVNGHFADPIEVELPTPAFGPHILVAHFTGTTDYAPSDSAPQQITIAPSRQTTDTGGNSVKAGVTSDRLFRPLGSPTLWVICALDSFDGVDLGSQAPAPPPGLEFVHGILRFDMGCINIFPGGGSFLPASERLVLGFDTPLPPGSTAWVYGPTHSRPESHWHQIDAAIEGTQVSAWLTDGGDEDDSLVPDLHIRGFFAIATPRSFQDIWWAGPQENGWGASVIQHGDTIYANFYVYDAAGRPTWIVMPRGEWDDEHSTYSGDLYVPTGSWFGHYDAAKFDVGPSVGRASLAFTSADGATLRYTIGGISGTKSIVRQAFGDSDATATDHSDLWWAGFDENGWGITLHQHGRDLFGVLFSYDASGSPTWFAISGGTWTDDAHFVGIAYRSKASPWAGATYDAGAFTASAAGTVSLAFDGTASGTITYAIDGVRVTRAVMRQAFR